MEVGQTFNSLEDLERTIKQFEMGTFSNFAKFRSRTIEGARAKGLKRAINPKLEYVELDYNCIKSGKFVSKSKGARPKQSSFREECPVHIRVRINDDGTKLIIKSLETKHNHDTSQAIYNHLPRQRQLDPEAKAMAAKLVTMKVNKKLLQNELMKSHGKIITLKDIHNLNINSKQNDFASLIEQYQNQKETTLDIVKNEDGVLRAIFYQDKEMRRLFELCPEILFIDAIYKVNDRRMPLYVFLVEDPNGLSEIVGFCLLTSEDAGNVSNMAQLFKRHNMNWEKTLCIMADKDFNERNIFHLEFPQSKLLICIFHAMRSFHREITTEKMNITKGQRNLCLQIIQKMVYAKSTQHYMQLYGDLKKTKLAKVIDYFDKNWHKIREEWVIKFQEESQTFGNRTNNRLESTNQKITQVVSRLSRLDQLFEGLDNVVTTLRTERDHIAANVFSKTCVLSQNLNETLQEFYKYLTPFAFEMVSQQMGLEEKVQIMSADQGSQSITALCSSGIVDVTTTSCQCTFRSSTALPCRHILKTRNFFNLTLYCPDLCATRWTREYYRKVCRIFPSANQTDLNTATENENSNLKIILVPDKKKRIISYRERFRISKMETDQMASIMAEATGTRFEIRMKELLNLKHKWTHEDQEMTPDIRQPEFEEPIESMGQEATESGSIEFLGDEQVTQIEPTEQESIDLETIEFEYLEPSEERIVSESEETVIMELEVTRAEINGLDANFDFEVENGNDGTNNVCTENSSLEKREKRKRGRPKLGENRNKSSEEPPINSINENLTSIGDNLTLPPKVPKRGRPKGANLTVIGLPKKKVKKTL